MGKELLGCPAPYLLGIHRSPSSIDNDEFKDSLAADDAAIVIDLDRNIVTMNSSLKAMVDCSMRLVDKLAAVVTPNLWNCDEIVSNELVGEINDTVELTFFVLLLLFN